MISKIIFQFIVVLTLFSCASDDSNNNEDECCIANSEIILNGTFVEESPIENRTEIVIDWEGKALDVYNEDIDYLILSFSILEIGEDYIELSDNLADLDGSIIFPFKIISEENLIIENLYLVEETVFTFRKK